MSIDMYVCTCACIYARMCALLSMCVHSCLIHNACVTWMRLHRHITKDWAKVSLEDQYAAGLMTCANVRCNNMKQGPLFPVGVAPLCSATASSSATMHCNRIKHWSQTPECFAPLCHFPRSMYFDRNVCRRSKHVKFKIKPATWSTYSSLCTQLSSEEPSTQGNGIMFCSMNCKLQALESGQDLTWAGLVGPDAQGRDTLTSGTHWDTAHTVGAAASFFAKFPIE